MNDRNDTDHLCAVTKTKGNSRRSLYLQDSPEATRATVGGFLGKGPPWCSGELLHRSQASRPAGQPSKSVLAWQSGIVARSEAWGVYVGAVPVEGQVDKPAAGGNIPSCTAEIWTGLGKPGSAVRCP